MKMWWPERAPQKLTPCETAPNTLFLEDVLEAKENDLHVDWESLELRYPNARATLVQMREEVVAGKNEKKITPRKNGPKYSVFAGCARGKRKRMQPLLFEGRQMTIKHSKGMSTGKLSISKCERYARSNA
eukprot:3457568-Amphidinium_carterae.1